MKILYKRRKLLRILLAAIFSGFLIFALYFGYSAYIFLSPNIFLNEEEKTSIEITNEDTTLNSLIKIINEKAEIQSLWSLKKAFKRSEANTIRSGRYEIRNRMNNKEFVQMIMRGLQSPVNVTFNNIRTKEQLCGVFAKQLMVDSLDLLELFNDSVFLADYDLTTDNMLTIFIPNTYSMFWNIGPKRIFERMYKEHANFWNEERIKKANEIPLTPTEVSILASIVEEETSRSSEFPIVAGLYINRLKKGIFLQADPTVKYAVGDVKLRRVLNVHLKTDSPYNTYKYKGLPPGPIRIPSIKTIDAVLNYEKHNYLFMAAKETLNGEHNFASSLSEHNENARKYRNALNNLKIFN